MREKEKTTVPVPSVGADGEQSLSYVSNKIIATESEEINLNVNKARLFNEYQIDYEPVRTHAGRRIALKRVSEQRDDA